MLNGVRGLKERLSSYRITLVGWLVIVVVAGGLIVAEVGPTSAQRPAFILAVGVLGVALLGTVSGGGFGRSARTLADRRAEFEPLQRDAHDDPAEPVTDADAWQRERERRAARGR